VRHRRPWYRRDARRRREDHLRRSPRPVICDSKILPVPACAVRTGAVRMRRGGPGPWGRGRDRAAAFLVAAISGGRSGQRRCR
jgi:hypothetical protein